MAHDEIPYLSNSFNYQERHYLGLVAKMECHLLHSYDHGRLAHDETPYPLLLHFHILILSYFDAFIVKRGRLIYSLRVTDCVRSKKNANESLYFLPTYHHIKMIYPFESVKNKPSWF